MKEKKEKFELSPLFKEPVSFDEGIYRALAKRPSLPLAQSANFLALTAALYEPLWRMRSLSIITAGSFNVERELKLMLEWLEPQPQHTLLDAACSAGLYARTLLEHEPSLTIHALDFSLPFLKKAKQLADYPLTLVHADVSDLPYQNESFDTLVCGGSLNEFLDLPKVIEEFARVLKPGGKLWLMYIKRAEGFWGKRVQALLRLSGIHFISPDKLEELCLSTNLNLVKAQHRSVVAMALFTKN